MEIYEEEVSPGLFKINLIGRMDIVGVGEIEVRFTGMCASPRSALIVDMSGVNYMSSLGIRALLMNGKAVTRRGGKFVLLSPQPVVKNVLEVSGIDKILQICDTLEDAMTKVKP